MKATEIFSCSSCPKEFTTKFSLNRHQLVHNQVKNFTCNFCPKKFALKQYLKEHECIHTNSRPYVCGVNGCQQRFRQRGKLSLHRRKHKGYRMKEYHLIKRSEDASHEISEDDTVLDNIHQDFEDSLNESSEAIVDTAKFQSKKKKESSRRKRKASLNNQESDSDFELPSYSITKN